jgi:hypothetical protein
MDEEKRCPAIDQYESDQPPEKVLEACEHCGRKATDCPIFIDAIKLPEIKPTNLYTMRYCPHCKGKHAHCGPECLRCGAINPKQIKIQFFEKFKDKFPFLK